MFSSCWDKVFSTVEFPRRLLLFMWLRGNINEKSITSIYHVVKEVNGIKPTGLIDVIDFVVCFLLAIQASTVASGISLC